MKTIIATILLLIAGAAFAAGPTGLTADDTGAWYDPAFDGAGFSLYVIPVEDEPPQIAGMFFAKPIYGWFRDAVWFGIQCQPTVAATCPLLLVKREFRVAPWTRPPEFATAGSVTFHKNPDGTITADVAVDHSGHPMFSPAPPVFTKHMILHKLL